MPYVMIAVFDVEELPNVLREFIGTGKVESVKPAYVNTRKATNKDRAKILEFIKEKGDVGYDDVLKAELGMNAKSLGYNLKELIDSGEIIRIGEKPYRYQIAE